MKVEPINDLSASPASILVDELIARFNLSEDSVVRIRATMQATGASFVEAAVQLQLITTEQVKAAMDNTVNTDGDEISIIESVRRKTMNRRPAVVLREPEEGCTPGTRLTIAHDPYSERSEKLRGLRTELTLRFGPSSTAVMLAIVSARNGEGRSQLAAELAIAFAQLERRTLLVDADLRSPGQHKLFGCPNDNGLSQAINNGSPPFLYKVAGVQQMHLLTAGPAPNNPIELLSMKRFDQLVHTWRQQYDFIVFDTPPVTAFADALTVSTIVKRVLLTTRANHSLVSDAKEMLRRLSITHSEILGAVFNKF